MMDDDLWQQPVQWYERFYPADHIESTPADWEYRYMLRIVAYDITDDKRLRKVAKICELYGVRVEKSVFECDLPDERFQDFWLELMGVIEEDDDCVVAYQICKACVKQVEVLGKISRPRKAICYII